MHPTRPMLHARIQSPLGLAPLRQCGAAVLAGPRQGWQGAQHSRSRRAIGMLCQQAVVSWARDADGAQEAHPADGLANPSWAPWHSTHIRWRRLGQHSRWAVTRLSPRSGGIRARVCVREGAGGRRATGRPRSDGGGVAGCAGVDRSLIRRVGTQPSNRIVCPYMRQCTLDDACDSAGLQVPGIPRSAGTRARSLKHLCW